MAINNEKAKTSKVNQMKAINTGKPQKDQQEEEESPCLPMPKPRHYTEYVRQSQFLLWLWNTAQEISFGYEYEEYLRDGVILCRLMHRLAPDIIGNHGKQVEKGDNKNVKRENICKFLQSCRSFGLAEDQLFDVEDLLSMLDISRVTKCLFALGQHASEKNGKLPRLDKPYDELLNEHFGANIDPRLMGMPNGDDLLVSHVNTEWLKKCLKLRRERDMAKIKRPPRDPLVQRTPSIPMAELKAMFAASEQNGKQEQPKPEMPITTDF